MWLLLVLMKLLLQHFHHHISTRRSLLAKDSLDSHSGMDVVIEAGVQFLFHEFLLFSLGFAFLIPPVKITTGKLVIL